MASITISFFVIHIERVHMATVPELLEDFQYPQDDLYEEYDPAWMEFIEQGFRQADEKAHAIGRYLDADICMMDDCKRFGYLFPFREDGNEYSGICGYHLIQVYRYCDFLLTPKFLSDLDDMDMYIRDESHYPPRMIMEDEDD